MIEYDSSTVGVYSAEARLALQHYCAPQYSDPASALLWGDGRTVTRCRCRTVSRSRNTMKEDPETKPYLCKCPIQSYIYNKQNMTQNIKIKAGRITIISNKLQQRLIHGMVQVLLADNYFEDYIALKKCYMIFSNYSVTAIFHYKYLD